MWQFQCLLAALYPANEFPGAAKPAARDRPSVIQQILRQLRQPDVGILCLFRLSRRARHHIPGPTPIRRLG
ncbi:hypothetical protein ASZ90_014125 [hydrocarbon metagenome]|uniref:Uncharacterized protein n=1 Tax=hydrocarbon metagenome TaxID=938273 RepID=A0A0W8F5P3_9ZZZZ